ncbi:MAG: sigma-70 family RNA polymerase sigma factor [Pseudomonadota bacterium]
MSGFDVRLPELLVRGVIAGRRHDQVRAYEVLAPAIMTLATRILQDRHQAEEVVQDTFVDVVEKARGVRTPGAFVGWVKRVAVNHCLMRLRSPWHARREALDEPDAETAPVSAGGYGLDPQSDSHAQRTLEAALGQLPDDARAVLWLHDVEGYTHKEIGQLMGHTTSYSKSQLARAYQKLLAWRLAGERAASGATPSRQGTQSEPQQRSIAGRTSTPTPA